MKATDSIAMIVTFAPAVSALHTSILAFDSTLGKMRKAMLLCPILLSFGYLGEVTAQFRHLFL